MTGFEPPSVLAYAAAVKRSRDSGIKARLVAAYQPVEDIYDPSLWWLDPDLLRDLVSALADLHRDGDPSVVVGIESRGLLLGALVAQHLRVGFVEVRKDEHPKDLGVPLLRRTTPPDYRDRGLTLTMRRKLLHPRDRVLLVDDWIDTGAQATAVTTLVGDAEATWIGCAVVVDALTSGIRQGLAVRSILRVHELP